ncbi:MAG: phosphoglycerate kinase [Candidatus Altiarchaeota archaeon]|nr:phosphoglycerate kinase [Candidatus Altiarchaeota archaeon]
MLKDIPTMDEFDFNGKTVLLRIDINSPINAKTGELLDDRRFRSHKDTIQELIEKKANIVLLAHQGRPGDSDFTTLEKHAGKLAEIIGHDVEYVDSIFSSFVLKKIRDMNPGDIILLENVRFYSEEVLKRPPDVQATTFIVKKLSPAVDFFINDAFATAHRSQPSLVGFPNALPSAAGRLMEKEIRVIDDILKKPKKPLTFVLGGTKADDSLKASERALGNGAEYILTGGLVANIFLAAKGYRIGEPNIEFIRGKKMTEQIDVARELLNNYEENIILPVDLALDHHGGRTEISVSELPTNYMIKDVGSETVKTYGEILKKSGTVFAKGALGVFEEKEFTFGTVEVLNSIANSEAFSVIGGGHLVAAARELSLKDRITHISSGGGACISLLAGYKLPAVEVLKRR